MPPSASRAALALASLLPIFPNTVLAQDLSAPGALGADILPRGRSAVRVETRGSWADQQYDARGRREPLASDYDGLALDATLFPGLLPPGMSLGTTDLAARMVGRQVRLTFGHGFGEDLTAGFQIGYGEATNHVRAGVSGSNLAANPFFNPALPMAFPNVPFVPLGTFGLTTPTGAEEVQTVLTDPLYGLAYRRVADSTWRSALDPMLGLRWRFDRGEGHATVFAPTLRIGVARQADPDDLMQMVLADGTTDLLFGVLHTRRLGGGWDLKLSAQYTMQFPDHVVARARSANELLVPATRRERMERDRTDPLELTAEVGYGLGDWHLSGRLEYARGGQDRYTSPTGQDTSGLSAGTDFHFLLGYLGLSWNGIPGHLRGEHRVPAIVSLVAATTLEARNTAAPDSLYLTVTLPF